MKRLNPQTNKIFKYGEVREDGYVFVKYKNDRMKKNGFLGEKWLSPESFAKDKITKTLNKKRSSFHAAMQRAKMLNRVPTWLTADDKKQIKRFYEMAKQATLETGILHHVDHVIPLQGNLVSGLHTPINLQVISAKDNIRKANDFYFSQSEKV